jgi:hypothetical protein
LSFFTIFFFCFDNNPLDLIVIVIPPFRRRQFPLPFYCKKNQIKWKKKGNQSGIYHVPGGQYYDVTNAEEWFCSTAEAEAAGFREKIKKKEPVLGFSFKSKTERKFGY